MRDYRSERGFTLIELLVVIAIIGILASVVLAAMSSARNRGYNALIKENLKNARAQASLYYDDAGNRYELNNILNSVCLNDPTDTPKGIAEQVAGADIANEAGLVACHDDILHWAVAVQLVGDDSDKYFCVDGEGFSGTIVGTVGGADASDFTVADVSCK